jgi:cytochrome c oxidase subunit 2
MRIASLHRRILALLPALILGGCNDFQSAIDPEGDAADKIKTLLDWYTLVTATVWVLVMIALVLALIRSTPQPAKPLLLKMGRAAVYIVATATVLTALTVAGLATASYFTDRQLLAIGERDALEIKVTGHQWWWDLRYEDAVPSRILTSANEIHVPVGRPVRLQFESRDVIHSFWVPSLAGKMDLIPGRHNELAFTAAKPGTYRGQCAEFCGYEHAHMGILVIADPPEKFEAWRNAQLAPAANVTGEAAHGKDIFLKSGCIHCHTVRGTSAGGRLGPDLTHIGSRQSLAADTLSLSHDNLVAWLSTPQHIKPGANMPRVALSDADFDAVASYLEALK